MRSALSQSDVSEALEGSICPMAWFDQCPETPDAPIPVSDRTCCGTKPPGPARLAEHSTRRRFVLHIVAIGAAVGSLDPSAQGPERS